MEYAPHGKKLERKYTQHEAQCRPNGRRQREEDALQGRKPESNHSSNRDVPPFTTDYCRYNSDPISSISTSPPLRDNILIPNRFDTHSVVSSIQPDDIQDTSTVRPTPKMRAPRAHVAQAIDRPAIDIPSCKSVVSRPPPAALYGSKLEPPPIGKPRDRSVQAETKSHLSCPWNDMAEWPHNPNRLSRPFRDMPAFYRENTPPPPPTIAQRRRQKKKAQAEKQEHMLWHGVSPPTKDSPFVREQLGTVKEKVRQDVWYYQKSWM